MQFIPFSYHQPAFWMIFLPAVVILYQSVPQKYRQFILLLSSWLFFALWSKYLIAYHLVTVAITYFIGKKLATMTKPPKGDAKKPFLRKRRLLLTAGILSVLLILAVLKYKNMASRIICLFLHKEFQPEILMVPLGISYYTLQAISYMCDVKNGKIQASDSFWKLALYMSFFPTIMEGPITRFGDVADDLAAGHDITLENLSLGFQRILIGLFKKMVIADHLAAGVSVIFQSYTDNGVLCLLGAVLCTMQLYMDFAGTIDIAIGSGKIFGVTLTENFRQPFFAKNASEFWRRWHITLGAFLRDYVFYPVSLSKPVQSITKWAKKHLGKVPARYIGPLIALLCVWLCNGLWHGPRGSYIAYGLYYFFFISAELLLENPVKSFNEKFHLDENGWGWKTFRFVKLFIIVIFGELIFTAERLSTGSHMIGSIFTRFDLSTLSGALDIGMRTHDFIIAGSGILVILILDICKEKGIPVQEKFNNLKTWQRWAVLYTVMFIIIIFGAYGTGYDAIAMMYAGF